MPTPLLKLGGLSRATGVSVPTLGRWFDRGTIKQSRRDKASTGHGDHRQFSRNTVVQIAIARKLIELGIAAGRANDAASLFTDEGQTGRAPGELFSCGKTLLTLGPNGASVRNVFHDTPWSDLTKHGACTIIVDLNRVVEQVDSALDSQKAN
jgi:DNA-binding transcriptional MerR regulator